MSRSAVAVIVVNYGTADLTIAAVRSVLARHHGGRAVTVHMVDNASPGDDAARLREAIAQEGWGPRATLHAETENRGFGTGNNVALAALAAAEVPPEYVMLLNPDACLENEAIAVLADFMDARPRVGAVGAALTAPSGGAAAAAFRFPGATSLFVHDALRFGPLTRLCAGAAVALPEPVERSQVDWVTGAAVMLRREAVAEVGGFDPGFFLYFEEVDLMRRLGAAGWEIWTEPAARVMHIEGAATAQNRPGERFRRPAYWYASWLRYVVKHHGRPDAVGAACLWAAGHALNLPLSWAQGRVPSAPTHFFGDLWTHVLRPLLGLGGRSYG